MKKGIAVKAIKGIAELTSVLSVLAGIILCMCEVSDGGSVKAQFSSLVIGFLFVVFGALLGTLAGKRGEHGEFDDLD